MSETTRKTDMRATARAAITLLHGHTMGESMGVIGEMMTQVLCWAPREIRGELLTEWLIALEAALNKTDEITKDAG